MNRGYIGLTDPDRYDFLSGQPRVDEVNFWQPHGSRAFRALTRGDLFFFKLRAPLRDIVGFGFFERFEIVPAWQAWDAFGPMNGAPDFEVMVDRIVRLRGDDSPESRAGQFKIGCIMISAPIFFPRSGAVLPPRDWARTGIQQGKSYDLRSGEGARVLADCLASVREGARDWNVEEATDGDAARYGSPLLVRPRLGQGLFSFAVRDAYKGACAVTHEHSQPVLEAAHIRPYARGGPHDVDNGLLLRRDLHRLFDLGYVTVTPDHLFRVGNRLREEFKNGRSYYELNNTRIEVPPESVLQPSKTALEWHGATIFRG